MAVHALTTAVKTLGERIVALEPLSIAEITAGTPAEMMWNWRSQTYPYWSNRIAALTEIDRGQKKWQVTHIARLNLAHIAASTVGSTTPQELAWQYVPEVLMYFRAVRLTLAPTGYTEIIYLAAEGITITCPGGMDYAFNPYTGTEALYIDFQIVAPFQLFMDL